MVFVCQLHARNLEIVASLFKCDLRNMARNKFTFINAPLALDAVSIGSLVPDKTQPDQDAVIVEGAEAPAVTRTQDVDFRAKVAPKSSSSFTAALTRLLSLQLSSESTGLVEIAAAQGYQYMLKQPRDVFRQLCEDIKVQLELERNALAGDDDWHFVVGFKTVVDGSFARGTSKATGAGLTARVPVGAAAGVDPSCSGVLDAEIKATHSRNYTSDDSFQAMGERVYSVCYRKVKIELKKGELQVDAMRMGKKNSWYWISDTGARSAHAVQKFVEASFEEGEEGGEGEDSARDDGEIIAWEDETEVFVTLKD